MNGDRLHAETSTVSAPKIETSSFVRIHAGPRHNIYRGRTIDGESIIKKTTAALPTMRAVALVHHEYELLRDLQIPGIVKVLGLVQAPDGASVLMADAGDSNLAERIRLNRPSIGEFLDLAIELSEAVGAIHGARIVHRGINPGNIVWDTKSRRATLGDFGFATTLAGLAVESVGPGQPEGTLAYISPEQTGRTGRSVDSRSDLYSLGITLYEVLTGDPPFTSRDPVELVHAHIARWPLAPHEASPDYPIVVSRIVLKLLEKEPKLRYQTAEALASDLRQARTQWLVEKTISPFPLGQHDVPRELSIADKLYGREEQVKTLREAFARACQGGHELVLVTGAPGIGKSALVSHLGPDVAEHHGRYIAGKFDQLKRSIPFSGLAQAFRELVRQLLTETQADLTVWRERIELAVAPNGQILVDIVPELGHILGPQSVVPELGPVEVKNRFYSVFTQFLQVFAQPEHPLVLFLDDLQWADAASLQLLEQWIGTTASHHLLLVGSYRDSEVGPSHPLSIAVSGLRDAGNALHEMHLGPIGADDIAQLAAEAVDTNAAETRPLAELIRRKTAGNPFFVRRLIQLLHAQNLVRFDPNSQSWIWDLDEIERAPLADNVLDLMVQAIERLPDPTRRLLESGACIGHRFDIVTLAEVNGLSRTAAADRLWPAFEDGLLLPVRESYESPPRNGPPDAGRDGLPGVVQFAHDRVQQAAYSLLGEENRREIHLRVGRHLLEVAANDPLDDRLFDIVDQLDLGEMLIVAPDERLRLVELNLAAGRKAKTSAAYQAACEYLTVARRHLAERSWDERPELTFALFRELAECAYLAGQHAMAEALIETAIEHAPTKVAKVDLYSLRVLAATVASDWLRALRWGREGLAVFGLEWPLEGLAGANEAEATTAMSSVGERRIQDLLHVPEVGDDEMRACMRLLSILGPPAYFSGADVLTFLVTRATNLSLVHGPSPYSAYAYAFYAGIHNARTGEYDVGYAFGRLALGLAQRFGNRAEESRTLEVFGLIVHPWKAALRESLPLLRDGFRAGVESGELAYAAFNLNSVLINGLPVGVPLPDLLVDADAAIEFATRHKNRTSIEMAVPFRQFARALTGRTRAATNIEDDDFEAARFLEEAKGNQTALGFFWVARLQLEYLLGDYAAARQSSQKGAGPVEAGNLGMVTSVDHVFYTALTLLANCGEARGRDTAPLDEPCALHRKLVSWAEQAPENFAHKAALVGAEIARVRGEPAEAMKLYRQAIDAASQQLFVPDEALAHELRARLLLSEQEPELAAVHFRAAWARYQTWGASVKVHALEREQPDFFAVELGTRAAEASIDALALIKASQAISAERAPAQLFERILRVAAEVAGAQRGALVLPENDALIVRARIDTAEGVSVSTEATTLDRCADLPSAILRYVLRLREPLVLSDASSDGAFVTDRTVRVRQLRSVICVPLSHQAKLVGLLYLENGTMAGAFADQLVEIVQVLAAQAAISLENSSLLNALQRLTGALEERVGERTRQLADEIAARDRAEAALLQAQKMEALGQLTGGVAHDFNNLLSVISGNLDLLGLRAGPDGGIQRFVEAAQRAVSRGSRLTQQLLAFARRQILRPETRDLGAAIVECEGLIRHAVGEAIEVDIIIDRDVCPCSIDPSQFDNAILNLALNARDAMPKGGKLTISVRNLELDHSNGLEAAPGPYILVSVADVGEGIAPDLLERVFEPFFTTKDVGKGTGLGLSQVYGFVKQSNGHIRIHSELGAGTTVLIYLPKTLGAIHEDERFDTGVAVPQPGSETILVVEDNPEVLKGTAASLEVLGYRVLCAENGPEALAVLKRGDPIDLLFTDVVMPHGISGGELAELARAMRPGLKVLLTSGYAGPVSGMAVANLPMLAKPYRLVELSNTIRVVLSK